MKGIYAKLALVLFVLNGSCTDDLEPENSITAEAFYTNGKNLEAGLTAVYSALQSIGITGFPQLEGMSDNAISDFQGFAPDVVAYAAGEQVTVTRTFKEFYGDNYVLVQRANLLLDYVDDVPAVTDSDRSSIKAEARALRAFSYMNLVYLYGDVPLIKKFTGREEVLSLSRTPRTEVMAFVLNELEEAASDLSTTPVADGRLTRQAVLGLLGRAMLYEARMGNKTWQEALAVINDAVKEANNGGNALVDNDRPSTDYQSVFMETNEGNKEVLFSARNSNEDRSFSYKEDYSWQAGHLRFHIHQNLADAYPYADGTTYDPNDGTYVGRDPRLSTNIMHEGLTFDGLTYDGTDNNGFVGLNSLASVTNLFFNKFVTTDFSSTFNEGQLDLPILRYAELLLMRAEALNETGGNPYPSINAVRDRAGLPALSGLSQSALKDAIILERRLEFAGEGLRWFDLITLGIADEVINGIDEESPEVVRAFTLGRSELVPVPQTEIGLNPNLTQNPGY